MGTCWLWANWTKREFVDPHHCGQGAHWGECARPGTPVMTRLATLLQDGRWSSDDVIEAIPDFDDQHYQIEASSYEENHLRCVGCPDDEWKRKHEEALLKVGKWTDVSAADEVWDDEKAAVLSPVAEEHGWYER